MILATCLGLAASFNFLQHFFLVWWLHDGQAVLCAFDFFAAGDDLSTDIFSALLPR